MRSQRLTVLCLSIAIASALTGPLRAELIDLTAIINVAQEIPAPTGALASAAGFASVQLDDATNELSWSVAWQDLTGPPTGMHFHAPAGPGSNAGVAVNIGAISGLTSPSVGSTTVSDEFAGQLLSGQSYVNIHTAQNGPGEIRGQVSSENIGLLADLNADQATPAPTGVPADAGGSALLAFDPATNTLGWHVHWQNLSGPATAMHFHGPAGFGETAGVQLNVGAISGLTSPSIGSAVITDEFEEQLLSGNWYLNIHTAQNPPGEIRGQVVPEPASATLALVALLLGMPWRITRWSSAFA
jgi:hypothetical protein